jgi:hypothetical protein
MRPLIGAVTALADLIAFQPFIAKAVGTVLPFSAVLGLDRVWLTWSIGALATYKACDRDNLHVSIEIT